MPDGRRKAVKPEQDQGEPQQAGQEPQVAGFEQA
jgi:hypothetical protein